MNGIAVRPLLVAVVLSCQIGVHAFGDDFRIETKVYQGKEEAPINETVTLFHDGVVYDFLASPAQIAVFRKSSSDSAGRFILLDPERKLQTELSTDSIENALLKLRTWASRQRDPLLRFAANPNFDESFTPESGELVLASYQQTYRVATTPATKPAALAEYREFLDWYTQLGAMHRGLPPQPRLALNEALARHAVIPVSVELKRVGVDESIVAKHDFTWRLSREDRTRIGEVHDALGSYESVSNAEFLRHQAEPTATE